MKNYLQSAATFFSAFLTTFLKMVESYTFLSRKNEMQKDTCIWSLVIILQKSVLMKHDRVLGLQMRYLVSNRSTLNTTLSLILHF